ncbi:hypothetical protein LSTR_LSTR014737 [Laodelphax striatellus]|uniref:Uncharacterized protein n=1 Tax=Laodelphax striatellus TaxID=195883 RepID=A0A482WVW4_LAOST|nr:hypothetical protein LSTR_LSTR014737 [Laodelphax striatellus]
MINADVREMSHGAAFEEVFYAPLRHWLVAASSVAFKRALVAVSSCRLFRVAVVALSWKLCDATVSLGLNCTIGRLIRVQTLPMNTELLLWRQHTVLRFVSCCLSPVFKPFLSTVYSKSIQQGRYSIQEYLKMIFIEALRGVRFQEFLEMEHYNLCSMSDEKAPVSPNVATG